MGFLTKLFGTNMAKEIKRIDPIVRKIEALEEEYKGLTDFSPRPLPPAGRPRTGFWGFAPTGCSSSAASFSTRAASPR